MKKLMFAAVAAAMAGAVFADGEVTSQVVGFQEVLTKTGFTYLAPTFEKITKGEKVTLADIVPVGDEVGFGTEFIQMFDEENGLAGVYTYYVEDSGVAPEGNGWYDSEGNLVKIELGAGVGVLFESQGAAVRFCGQVATGTIVMDAINAGFTYICNVAPVKRSIQDFVPTGDNAGFGTEFAQIFDEENGLEIVLTYYVEDSGVAPEGNGWYNSNGEKVKLDFDPGYGFLFESAGDCTVELKAALD